MNPNYQALGFYDIIEKLKEFTLSDQAASYFDRLEPFMKEDTCRIKMHETTAARQIMDVCGSPPLPNMKDIDEVLILCDAGGMLMPEQLSSIAQFAASCKRTETYLKRGEEINGMVGSYGRSIIDLTEIRREIENSIHDNKVHDDASPQLRNIRRKKLHTESMIKEKLNAILKSRKEYLADGYISIRNGHYVLPVKRQHQNQFGGTVIEVSGKGSTVFMEPSSVSKLQAELSMLDMEEENEVRKILYTLSSMVSENSVQIRSNTETIQVLDIIFAKAKLSISMKANHVEIGGLRKIIINQGRHPLLPQENCVPLDFVMEESLKGVIITGPNTGGKTVTVKAVGLLSLMAQCGLHIPCGEGSYIAMNDKYLCDIGDSQNISQNLSTFSGHITNVINILESASGDSLVLLDELGSGTDPAEGMGIAVGVLEELRNRGCMFLVTTHYPQVKTYAEKAEGVQSARMAFDRESLMPLYRLEMGKAGESCALYIAKRLGLAEHILETAHNQVYGDSNVVEKVKTMEKPKTKLIRTVPVKIVADVEGKFTMGDSVTDLTTGESGIVYRPADKNGDVIIQIKGEKRKVTHTRIKLQVAAAELYPPDYDFSIIFDTVENRKARTKMGKHYDPNISVTYEKEDYL